MLVTCTTNDSVHNGLKHSIIFIIHVNLVIERKKDKNSERSYLFHGRRVLGSRSVDAMSCRADTSTYTAVKTEPIKRRRPVNRCCWSAADAVAGDAGCGSCSASQCRPSEWRLARGVRVVKPTRRRFAILLMDQRPQCLMSEDSPTAGPDLYLARVTGARGGSIWHCLQENNSTETGNNAAKTHSKSIPFGSVINYSILF